MTTGLKEGTRLKSGKYRIERVLGQGSFGITYLASMKMTSAGSLGTMEAEVKVAVKEFFMSEVNSRREDGSSVEGSSGSVFTNYRKKFRKEAENLAKLSHPNIVKVFDVFDENNTTYYVMDFIEGENLDDYIARKGKLSESEAISIVKEVGNAVTYMHSRKMLHLDIKPKNVMRKSDGHCYLIDFGLSKQFTDDGEPESSTTIGLGTPGYAPVEQGEYKQDGSFPATLDVYALGATMFKMLTGERPPKATFVLNEGFPAEELVKAGVSEAIRSVVEKAMEPKRKNRYQDIATFIGNLKSKESVSQNDEQTVVAVKLESRTPKPRAQRPSPRQAKDSDRHSDRNGRNSDSKWFYLVSGIVVVLTVAFLVWVNLLPDENDTTANANVKEVTIHNGHEYVDLGLPSGVKWATCNVGASSPEDYGDYFAWGETSPKSEYTEENCKTYNKNIGNISGNPNYDAARANWGGTWRLPTNAECEELQENCRWTWTTNGGKNGYKVVGPNGNSIFLPAAGIVGYAGKNDGAGTDGEYWSSTPYEDDTQHAYSPDFRDGDQNVDWYYREHGRSVRPVTE